MAEKKSAGKEKTTAKGKPIPRNGRRKPPISKERLLTAIAGSHGIKAEVARRLKCDWITANKYIHIYAEDALPLLEAAAEEVTDLAERKLIDQIAAGEPWALKFWLSTRGKRRGFTERHELTGADGAPIAVAGPERMTLQEWNKHFGD